MSSTAVRVCALLLVVLMFLTQVQNSWAGRPYREKPGFCPLFPAPPPPGGSDFRLLSPDYQDTGCQSDFECQGKQKCCPPGICCRNICVDPLDRPMG
nr:auswaprin-a-like isoform X1 [Penaeus vannamei]